MRLPRSTLIRVLALALSWSCAFPLLVTHTQRSSRSSGTKRRNPDALMHLSHQTSSEVGVRQPQRRRRLSRLHGVGRRCTSPATSFHPPDPLVQHTAITLPTIRRRRSGRVRCRAGEDSCLENKLDSTATTRAVSAESEEQITPQAPATTTQLLESEAGTDRGTAAAPTAAAGEDFPTSPPLTMANGVVAPDDATNNGEPPPISERQGAASQDRSPPPAHTPLNWQESSPSFRELYTGRLPEWLLSRLEELGFACPTLVQRQALEVIMGDPQPDAVLHAQTGSGKTLAFLLPLFAAIDPPRAAVQGLVVVPTRELGLQVAGVAKRIAAATGPATGGKVQVMSVLEGSSNKRQRAWAWADPPHIVVGNPENLSKLVTTGAIRVNAVSYVVVDEVDACLLSETTRAHLHELLARSLSPTHLDEDGKEAEEEEAARLLAVGAGRISGAMLPVARRVKERQTVFASATVPQHKHFIRQCVQKQWTLNEPLHVQVHAKESMPPCLSHFYVVCPPEQKLPVLRALIRRELGMTAVRTPDGTGGAAGSSTSRAQKEADQPDKEHASGLVFALSTKPLEEISLTIDKALGGTGTRERGRDGSEPPLAEFLREELGLNARADTMSLFREGKTRVLISTDMAARGLDVPEITHVFNLDLPLDGEGYVHRGGRAGRLGRPGKIISLVTPAQEFVIRRLGNGIGVDIKKITLGSKRRRPPSLMS